MRNTPSPLVPSSYSNRTSLSMETHTGDTTPDTVSIRAPDLPPTAVKADSVTDADPAFSQNRTAVQTKPTPAAPASSTAPSKSKPQHLDRLNAQSPALSRSTSQSEETDSSTTAVKDFPRGSRLDRLLDRSILQHFPAKKSNSAPSTKVEPAPKSTKKETEALSLDGSYPEPPDATHHSLNVDIIQYTGVQVVITKKLRQASCPYPIMLEKFGVSLWDWQSFAYPFLTSSITSKMMERTFEAGAFSDWLIEWNQKYFEPKGLHVDFTPREKQFQDLDVVNVDGQFPHTDNDHVKKAAKSMRLLVVVLSRKPNPSGGERPGIIFFNWMLRR